MAGNYPDAPGRRMAWDRDGTVMCHIYQYSNAISQVSETDRRSANDENGLAGIGPGDNVSPGWWWVLIFPEPRDITHYFIYTTHGNYSTPAELETSVDTTNGVDGTWTLRDSVYNNGGALASNARTGIQTLAGATGIKAIRFRVRHDYSNFGGNSLRTLHLYGDRSAVNRLAIWHPTLDQEIDGAHFDWADVPRSSSGDRLFRVKNLSPTLTASAPVVSIGALTDTSPSVASQHLFSLDGTNFAANQTLPGLAPGEVSEPITLRRNLASSATMGLWWARIAAVAATWTT